MRSHVHAAKTGSMQTLKDAETHRHDNAIVLFFHCCFCFCIFSVSFCFLHNLIFCFFVYVSLSDLRIVVVFIAIHLVLLLVIISLLFLFLSVFLPPSNFSFLHHVPNFYRGHRFCIAVSVAVAVFDSGEFNLYCRYRFGNCKIF